jgi:hypothetical protein
MLKNVNPLGMKLSKPLTKSYCILKFWMYLNLKDNKRITDMDYHFRKAELSEIPFGPF